MSNDSTIVSAARSRLRYEPETGRLLWTNAREAGRIGAEAGWTGANGYRYVQLAGKTLLVHRLIWQMEIGEPPAAIDHRDGDRLNNRLENLRSGDDSINAQNLRSAKRTSKSGILGVRWNAKNSNWVAEVCVGGKNRHLGCFESSDAASAAYLAAKRLAHAGCTI